MGLGSNDHTSLHEQSSPPLQLRHIASELRLAGLHIHDVSSMYVTEPVGGGRQPRFCNAVLKVSCTLPPARLLALAKALERRAGRRRGRRNGPRPIDIDILDFGGRVTGRTGPGRTRVLGRSSAGARSGVVLPHPELHRRRFALQPLLDVAPSWYHPVLGRSARQLLARLPARSGAVQRILDSDWLSCDEERLRCVWTASAGGWLRTSGSASSVAISCRHRRVMLPTGCCVLGADSD